MLRIEKLLLFAVAMIATFQVQAQTNPDNERWQQRCKYFMDIDMNTDKHQFKGTQRLIYYNNSPDEITKVFYHLYFNAFQPGSMMDERSRTIRDPDPRVGSRISKLKPEEIGYHKIKVLKHNGKDVKFHVEETILEVTLATPIKPGAVDTFYMEFDSQVPKQIRRSGRDSEQGIDYSMSQWYPKMCEYDYQGWHSNPYVGREFYGIWGDFDVKITLPKKYTIGATGYLQNPNDIGHGYEKVGYKPDLSKVERQTWNFIAPNVHDFVWGADPDYKHDVVDLDDTTQLHFFYQNNENFNPIWQKVQGTMLRAFKFIEGRYGDYPYRQYSFIEGGDGGMEYPMATLITGQREYPSLTGVMIHELMHTWFQMLMGSNEALYPWMDEGFTSFAEDVVESFVYNRLKAHDVASLNTHRGSYAGYTNLAKSGIEEPMSTHSDHYMTNAAYGTAAYSKGCVFITQMSYIVGEKVFDEAMLDYYNTWRFKHPNPNDFIRVMEKRSGLELDWYREYFVNSTHTIDYMIKDVADDKKETKVTLERHEWTDEKTGVRHGRMPMPIDIEVIYKDGREEKKVSYYIPLGLMRGEKADEGYYGPRTVLKDWWWTHKTYEFSLPFKSKDIIKITIDPSFRMADINVKDNVWEGK
jgi:hypothetical protein